MARLRRSHLPPPRRRGRRKPPVQWSLRLVAIAAAIAALCLMLSALVWGWRSGWFERQAQAVQASLWNQTLEWSRQAGLRVDDIVVEGRQETPLVDVLTELGIMRGGPIMEFDTAASQQRLRQLPWVSEAFVARRLPRRIVVRLIERRPMALWQNDRRMALIDDTGRVLTRENLERFRHLPLLVGEGAEKEGARFLAEVSQCSALSGRTLTAQRIANRRWDLRLDDKITLNFPEEQTASAIARLCKLQSQQHVLDGLFVSIDLRFEDRLIVQRRPDVAPDPIAPPPVKTGSKP
ncbi:MAG: FtsQ-type POTRA domain-containing protein [Alphaproteobacteria bacterium]|nr:MAG: FtsQ-type POTRA domain-containing protein [Alphaproteobacteria bacterium]